MQLLLSTFVPETQKCELECNFIAHNTGKSGMLGMMLPLAVVVDAAA